METFLISLIIFWGSFSCSTQVFPKNKAKVVEDYVLSAKFDTKSDLPQLKIDYNKTPIKKVWSGVKSQPLFEKKPNEVMISSNQRHDEDEDWHRDPEDYDDLEDREFMVHYHVPPPPPFLPHPLPPPPPPRPASHLPVAVPFPPFFAVGFIAFLILLNSLQTTLLLTTKNKSLLSSIKPSGRRKRFS